MKIGFALVSTFFLLSHASQINALTPVVTRSDPTTISFTLTPSIDDEVWAGWVGLPPGATIRRSFVSIDGPVRPAPRIAPAGWKGAPTIEVGDIGLLRFHRVCHVKVTTSALTPRGTIGVPKQIVVTLTLVGAKPSVLRKNPGFDTMLSSLLINWNSAQHWIEEFEVPDPPTPAPAPSVRILLRDEGLFRLTYDDLEDNLLQLIDDPGVIDPRRVALWNMGQLAPIAVHSSGPDSLWQPGDWIEFYAHGNWRQDPQGRWTSVEGKYTMDNPYFFVWDQDDPPRMADTPAEPQGGQTARFHWWVSHQEINDRPSISGHEGTIDDEWYWGDPFYPGELTKSFVINDIMQEGPAGEIRARFLAITDVDTVEYDHSVNLMLNGNLVAGDTWGGFGARLIEGSGVKAESGQNVLTIQSVGNPISGLRLDWFAVRYPRDYVVSGTQTSFAPSAEDNNEYAISGVAPGAKVEVFEVSTGLRLIGFQDVADHDGIVRFNYAIHDTGRIWVVQEEGWLSIDSTSLTHVRLDDPIADPSREGQYLVIYPADWLEQALGFKTLHLDRGDVQTADIVHLDDIWEEFSYGLRDPRALR